MAGEEREQVDPSLDLAKIPVEGTSEAERRKIFDNAEKRAIEQLTQELGRAPTQVEMAQRRFELYNKGFLQPAIIQEVAKKYGAGQADALKKQLENVPDVQKKLYEDAIIAALIKGIGAEQDTFVSWNKRFEKHQDEIISAAIAAKMSPYQALAGVASLKIFFGGVASMFGGSNPQMAEWGAEQMAAGIKMSEFAGDQIMKLDREQKMADKVRRTVDGFQMPMDYTGIGLRMERAITEGITDPKVRESLLKSLDAALGAAADNDRGTDGNFVKAYSAKTVATKVAMIKGASKFDPLFRAAERLYGLPEGDLKTVAVAESSLNPKATGIPTKYGTAKGLMQFIDSTARANGVDDSYDPVQAIFGAARYRASLYAKYGTSEAVDSHYYGMPGGKPTPDTLAYVANLKTLREKSGGVAVLEAPKGSIKTVSNDDLAEAKKSFTVADAGSVIKQAKDGVKQAQAPAPAKPGAKAEDRKVSLVDQPAGELVPPFMAVAAANADAYRGTSGRQIKLDAGVAVVALADQGQVADVGKKDPAANHKLKPLPGYNLNMT